MAAKLDTAKHSVIEHAELDCGSLEITVFDSLETGAYTMLIEDHEHERKFYFLEGDISYYPLYELFRAWRKADRLFYDTLGDGITSTEVNEMYEDKASAYIRGIWAIVRAGV